jgi:lipopolysaccharide/colanic/teichoic acid biosynthesis glycosyltransferase
VHTTTNGQDTGISAQKMHIPVSDYFAVKAWPTRAIGAVLLVLASPIIALLILIIRLTSPGPGFYRQTRTGRHGKEFHMYKIRTMYQDAESLSGPTWCKPGDSRITPVGKVLRLLHLDELPQLINIVRGEMDLIGPRPERPAFVELLAREIPNYRDRLGVLPGVTGLAQINLPPDETFDCVRKKLILDRDYIRSASASLDLRILICTSLRMLGIRHGRAVRLFCLERDVQLNSDSNGKLPKHAPQRSEHPTYQRADATYAASQHVNGSSVAVLKSSDEEDVYVPAVQEPAVALTRPARRPR